MGGTSPSGKFSIVNNTIMIALVSEGHVKNSMMTKRFVLFNKGRLHSRASFNFLIIFVGLASVVVGKDIIVFRFIIELYT